MRSYLLDARRVFVQLLPPQLRLPRMLALVTAIAKPVAIVTSAFATLVDRGRYHLNLTGQVVYLEHYLNDLFDVDARRIYIDDASPVLPPFLFRKSENRPLTLRKKGEAPTYWLKQSEYTEAAAFIVFVPAAVLAAASLTLMRAAVDRYRPAGRYYSIQAIP